MFTAVTLLTLAVGIGANTAIFSVVNGVLLKPLPYPDPDRLIAVWHTAPGLGIPEFNASPSTYFTYREENRTFEDVGIWRNDSVSVTGLAEPEQVRALMVSDGVLPIIGVQPARGRWFSRKDDSPGSPGTVMLFYGYWQRRFGGDPSAIGRRIVIDGQAREIVGVMPRSFRFLDSPAQLILPLQLNRGEAFIGNFSYQSLARLKPGVSISQASADVARMLPMMITKFKPAPGMNVQMIKDARIGPNLRPLKNDVVGDVGKVLWVLMGTVAIVLFIACANVANLLLVRAEGRRHELAIRAALGAGWPRIARELLFESVTIGLFGGALGAGLGYAAIQGLVATAPANLPRVEQISIDGTVLLFTLAISLLAGLLFGIVPVVKYAGAPLGSALRDGSRSVSDGRERHRARSVLVVVQVALALVLLISSGLMIRTLQALKGVRPGFTEPDQVLTLRVSLTDSQAPKPEQVVRTDNEILRRVAAVPGVTSAGLTNSVTMDGYTDNDPIFVEDHPYDESKIPPLRRFKFLVPGYFHTMGNPILVGRDFTWTDIYDMRSVVLVSENFAREYWGSVPAALGKRIRENPKAPWREIIGVAGVEYDDGVDAKPPAIVYWPMMLRDFWGQPVSVHRSMAFVIRSPRAGSSSFLKEVQSAVWSVQPDLPVANVRTLLQIYDRSMARTSFTLIMLSIAAAMALLLGIVGIYGVISYSVSQRTREIGIRMALGAPLETVRRMFVRHGMLLTGIGLVCGLVAALALTRLMSALLFGVSPMDPLTYLGVSVALGGAALLASYLPARRATVVDPVEALRAE
jgi:predicted permease